ncbi:MAG: potassium channel family protein [Candidatus Altiarchaeota archaeon]|nr:potassium channel family protein [Candidatus Altiarchaeota archaeon]
MTDEVEGVDNIVGHAISRKRNVKDILVEMKDTSELMVDLAYSALLTNSKDIAEEVFELEQKMDDLRYEIETLLLLAARTPEEAADLSGILHVAVAAENIADSAEEIADVVLRGVGDHPIYKTMLGESEEQVVRTRVDGGSELSGKTLGEFRVSSKTGCYIRAIRRGVAWIYNPKRDTKILEGDILITSGTENAVDMLKKLSKTK